MKFKEGDILIYKTQTPGPIFNILKQHGTYKVVNVGVYGSGIIAVAAKQGAVYGGVVHYSSVENFTNIKDLSAVEKIIYNIEEESKE
jgi:hypothetical protein